LSKQGASWGCCQSDFGSGYPAGESIADRNFQRCRLLQQEKTWARLPLESEPTLYSWKGNPAEHINDIRRCRRVMKNGVLDKSADRYLAVGMKPAD
jgi:hypothetical protein